MYIKNLVLILIYSLIFPLISLSKNPNGKILLNIKLIGSENLDSINYTYKSRNYKSNLVISRSQKIINNSFSIDIDIDEPITIYIKKSKYKYYIEPGDRIFIIDNNGKMSFSGVGSEKLKLTQAIQEEYKKNGLPLSHRGKWALSLEEYLDVSEMLDKKNDILNRKCDEYIKKISTLALESIKSDFAFQIEEERHENFRNIIWKYQKKEISLSKENLKRIFDSTITNATYYWLNKLDVPTTNVTYYEYIILTNAWMDDLLTVEGGESRSLRLKIYHDIAYNILGSHVYSMYLSYIIKNKGLKYYVFNDVIPYIQELQKIDTTTATMVQIKDKLERDRKSLQIAGWGITDLSKNLLCNIVDSTTTDKHITLLTIWPNKFSSEEKTLKYLNEIEKYMPTDESFKQINIISEQNTQNFINIINSNNPSEWISVSNQNASILFKNLNVNERPALFLLDGNSNFIFNTLPTDTIEDVIKQIGALSKILIPFLYDGPYVVLDDSEKIVYEINPSTIITPKVLLKNQELIVQSDVIGQPFKVKIKQQINIEPCIYKQPSKILAISDIEGNFSMLRQLLIANKVIDNKFNWIFGNGHLVFTGDMMDRGRQVTECLWLIYSLEDKAKEQGGHVHYILGNHEYMNLTGDIRYVAPKYIENAAKLKRKYSDLYSMETEIGQWLRSKNIIEKIGNHMFVHGGISSEIINLSLGLGDINEVVRNRLSSRQNIIDPKLEVIIDNKYSPFWYRGYYNSKETEKENELIDKTIGKYDVKNIITGHCLIENIKFYFNNKIINTDTYHSPETSQALLIENEKYYRVNLSGEKQLLAEE